MYDTKKKFRRSAATVICYVLAALMLIYTCYQIGSTIHMINEYYAQYGMSATPLEYFTYISQNALTPLINAVVFFMLAKILDEVRKNNPANYKSDDDIIEEDAAKKEAKDQKKIDKGEKAAAKAAEKAGAKTVSETKEDEPVIADFTTAAEEPKAEEAAEKKPAAKKPAAKKSAAKSSTAKKSTAKKPAAKKSVPKKTAEKKEEEKTEE